MVDIFVMMQFEERFNDVYACIKNAATKEHLDIHEDINCFRLDDITKPGHIGNELIAYIENCRIVIADITENNPNVLWEVGYAMALGKPVILLSQNIEASVFDIKQYRIIEYKQGDMSSTLNTKLKKYIVEILKEHPANLPKTEKILVNIPEHLSGPIPDAEIEAIVHRDKRIQLVNQVDYDRFLTYLVTHSDTKRTLYSCIGEGDWICVWLKRLFEEARKNTRPHIPIDCFHVKHLPEERARELEAHKFVSLRFTNRMIENINVLEETAASAGIEVKKLLFSEPSLPEFHGYRYGNWVLVGEWATKGGLHVRTGLEAIPEKDKQFRRYAEYFEN